MFILFSVCSNLDFFLLILINTCECSSHAISSALGGSVMIFLSISQSEKLTIRRLSTKTYHNIDFT